MLGWMISVRRVVDESAVRASLNVLPGDRVRVTVPDNAVGEVLAKWQAGVDGIRWIKQASEREGGVALEIECGYPHRYLGTC
jgi:hypothetical protein